MVQYFSFLLALIILFVARSVSMGLGSRLLSRVNEMFLFLCVFLFSGLRYYIGYDYTRYVARVENVDLLAAGLKRELLSYYLTKAASILGEPQFFFFANSLITTYLILITLRRYSGDFSLSVWMFVCFPMFYLNSFSVVRTFSAVAIVFYGVKYILKKQLWRYVLTVLVASLFHNTALIALPFYWLRDVKIGRRSSALVLFSFIILEPVFSFFFVRLFPRYSVYVLDGSFTSGRFTLVILVFVILLAVPLRNRLVCLNESNQLYYNCLLFAVAFYLMLFRYGTLAHRGTLYMYVYMLLLVPAMLQTIIPKQRIFLKWVICLAFIPMFLYMLTVGGTSYVPYEYRLKIFGLLW